MGTYPTKILLWAIAGKTVEGYYPPSVANLWRGSRSYRNNNPLNLRKGSYTEELGANDVDSGNFLIFPDFVSGFFGGCQFLQNACEGKYPLYDPNKGLTDFYNVFAPSKDNNDPLAYSVKVANFMQVSTTDPIADFLISESPVF